MDFLLVGLIIAAIPFVMPIASWVSTRRTRARVANLEEALESQRLAIDQLKAQVLQLRRQVREPEPIVGREAESPATSAADRIPVVAHTPPATAQPALEVTPSLAVPPEIPVSQPVVPPPPPLLEPLAPEPAVSIPRVPEIVTPAARSIPLKSEPVPSEDAAPEPIAPEPIETEPPVMPPPPPVAAAFDWESLVGVKLFSAISGIALVVSAVFFLKYSVEHGWLQPPIRVAIGVLVALALLVVCEFKAARRYPATANALDAAAIAILFATFFAAHALWSLIPALVTFALLGVVTAVAVLLSIRRESLFIAVLGLLGGFATPALLSTGENRPIPLFAYLMLLNVGLAWVAYRQTWPLLTGLTLALTTIYQWVWVFKFLDPGALSLAMGIFLVFPLATFAGLMLARRAPGSESTDADLTFERTAAAAAVLPLLFALYASAVPAYAARPGLVLGFLLLMDAGLFAVAVLRGQGMLHAAGAAATLVVNATWLMNAYTGASATIAVSFCAVFALFFVLAPLVAERFGDGLTDEGTHAQFAGPLMLFVLTVVGYVEGPGSVTLPVFGTLFVVVLAIAWRAIASEQGVLYFIAAFFAFATQASWASVHLSVERLGTGVAVFAIFGVVATVVPIVARRAGHPLQPAWGGGAVLLGSLALLLFLSAGPIAPAALWALALLLAIVNAGLFVESGAAGLPLVSIVGSLFSWVVLATWWLQAGAVVGVLPSLAVLAGLTLVTLAGHAWTHIRYRSSAGASAFSGGMYLGLGGHLFLFFVAANPAWSIPPWPLFGVLGVLTLAVSTVSLVTRASALHAAGAAAAGAVVVIWTYTTGTSWSLTGLFASAVASAFALGWLLIVRDSRTTGAAAATIFAGELTALAAVMTGAPPFAAVVVTHAVNLAILLGLTWAERWRGMAMWAIAPAGAALALQWQNGDLASGWIRLLVLASAIYAVFIGYPIVLGRRTRGERDPYIAAVLASALVFFAARAALTAGGLAWMVGALPVVEGAVMAVLLRQLLRMEPSGERDLGRLALVAGATLAFVTVAIPLQLEKQWITIGWALEGAALAWLFRRIPHRGLLAWGLALFGAVFVRLAANPAVLVYEPRGSLRIFNWYLYAYVICAVAFLAASWWLSTADDRAADWLPRASPILAAGGVILLFLVLNIEIADFYATGPTIVFRFGERVSQDLTYPIGWLAFGMLLLAACIYLHNKPGRISALVLIAVTTFKCFLYDLASLGGLYRVASFVGLAFSLALVSLAMQKYVLAKPEKRS